MNHAGRMSRPAHPARKGNHTAPHGARIETMSDATNTATQDTPATQSKGRKDTRPLTFILRAGVGGKVLSRIPFTVAHPEGKGARWIRGTHPVASTLSDNTALCVSGKVLEIQGATLEALGLHIASAAYVSAPPPPSPLKGRKRAPKADATQGAQDATSASVDAQEGTQGAPLSDELASAIDAALSAPLGESQAHDTAQDTQGDATPTQGATDTAPTPEGDTPTEVAQDTPEAPPEAPPAEDTPQQTRKGRRKGRKGAK